MKSLKKRLIPLACRFLLKPKSFSAVPSGIRRIHCKVEDMKILSDTSNRVVVVNWQGETKYFRECKKRLALRPYVMNAVSLYYTYVKEDLYGDRAFIENCLRDQDSLKTFANMGMTNDLQSGAYRFLMGQGAHHIGLYDMDPSREERIKDLVQSIWGDLFSYSLNSGLKIGRFQTYHAVRGIATYRMAQLVGLESMIPKTEYALLCPEGQAPIFGTVMDSADGICMERMSCEERRNVASPALQRALHQLNLLDVLNSEKDHRIGNYHVVLTQGKAMGVVAFDNDSPNAFGLGGISFSTYMGCTPWAKEGKLQRLYVDQELARRILALQEKLVRSQLQDILNPLQLTALIRRIKKVKKVLSTAPESAFLTAEAWTEETLDQECSCTCGKTYLQQFLEKQKLLEQPWLKDRTSNH